MLFYGRQRRGFPFLLIAMLVVIVALAFGFANPQAAEFARDYLGLLFIVLLAGAVLVAFLAVVRPRRRP